MENLQGAGIKSKKMGKEAVGRGINWGFSSPHTLLPKDEKEEKIAFCSVDGAKRVPLNGNGPYSHEMNLTTGKTLFRIRWLHQSLRQGKRVAERDF